jgi:hypothetical protein
MHCCGKGERGASLSGRGQWACTLRRPAIEVANNRVQKKRELIAESVEVRQTLRSCARSLRGSLLALQCVVPFPRFRNIPG